VAKADVKLPEEFLMRLSRLGSKTDEICEKMLESGAEVVEGAVRGNLRAAVGNGTKIPSRSTGELLESLGTSPVKQGRDGNLNIKVGFSEPRSDGKRNAMIAAILEYGKSGQSPKPFLKPAKTKSKKAMQAAMIATFEREVDGL